MDRANEAIFVGLGTFVVSVLGFGWMLVSTRVLLIPGFINQLVFFLLAVCAAIPVLLYIIVNITTHGAPEEFFSDKDKPPKL